MAINKNRILKLLFLVSFIYLLSGCPSDECDDVLDARLKLLADYSPLVDTFIIGDTLTISSSFSDSIWDINNQQYIFIPDFNFHTIIVIRRFKNGEQLDVDTQQNQLINNNVDISFTNTTIDKATGIDILEHNYNNNLYQFTLGYVFEKSGLYVIGVDALIGLSNSTDNQRFPGQCADQEVSAIFHRSIGKMDSNLEEYNFHMFRETEADIYAGASEEDFKEIAFYAFYVKE